MWENFCSFFCNMDCQRIVWTVAFFLGIILLIYGIVYWLKIKNRQDVNYAKAAVIEFFACWIMYIPSEYYNELVNNKYPVMRVIEAFFTALLRSLVVYQGSGYEKITYSNHLLFSSAYSTVRVIANIILLMLVCGLIVKFLNGPMQKIKLFFSKKKYTYVFTEVNDKTLAIASSIAQNPESPQKKNILFILRDRNDNADIEKINSFGGLCIYGHLISNLHILYKKTSGIELFLFTSDEDENLLELERICEKYEKNSTCHIKIYVELTQTPWSLYDEFLEKYNIDDNSPLIVNFVRVEENFIYNLLLEHSIFKHAIERDGYKEIKILIVGGMCERNFEFLKAVLHLGQMPGYRISITVVGDSEDRCMLRQKMPEIYDEANKVGDAIYSLHVRENISFESVEFDNVIEKEAADFSLAFVNAGSDLQNLNLAINLNAICVRRLRKENQYTLLVNVNNKRASADWNESIIKRLTLIGDIEQTYAHSHITMSKIEKASIEFHNVRQNEIKKEKEQNGEKYDIKPWIQYCNSEYNRHSVYARTLSLKYKVWLIKQNVKENSGSLYKECECTREVCLDSDGNETNIWKIYEHMRWNVYTRTKGYVLADKSLLKDGKLNRDIRGTAFVHNDLVLFNELDKEEQQKDSSYLTHEIIDILDKL